MTIHVNIGEAKTRFSALVAAALAGEEVIVQKAGVPKLRLVPIEEAERARREEIGRKRRAAFGVWEEKYRHLHGSEALTPPTMSDEELEARYRRKFGAPPA